MAIRVSTDDKTVSFPAFKSSNQLVVGYFSSLPDEVRQSAFERALAIGVMAMRDDRVAAFLSSTENELSLHLQSLKLMYEESTLAMKSAPVKGAAGELAVADALSKFTELRKLPDQVQLIGNVAGLLPKNKTGDLMCTVGDAEDAPTVVIECKLDKSVRLGDPAFDGLTKGRSDTAWSQLIEAKANRAADVAIMVFSADTTDRSIGAFTDSVRYVAGVGYIVLIDLPRGDFRPLAIAYELAREQALARRSQVVDAEQLDVLMRKMCADLNDAIQVKGFIESARQNLDKALSQIDESFKQFQATREALLNFLRAGKLEACDLLKLLVPHKTV